MTAWDPSPSRGDLGTTLLPSGLRIPPQIRSALQYSHFYCQVVGWSWNGMFSSKNILKTDSSPQTSLWSSVFLNISQDGVSTLTFLLKPTELIARWQKKKTGKLYEQSAKLSDGNTPWRPSDVVYLGGLPTSMWNVLREERKATSLKGFTGYIYDLTINGKRLSLREGTVYSEDGLINAFGASEAGLSDCLRRS